MDLNECAKEMSEAIALYAERHGEAPNTLYMTARLLARIEAWVLRDGFVQGSYGYLSGFGLVPPGKVAWFCGLTVKLLDGDGLRWAVAREHIVDEKILKG
ncbi:MAG: hypothetical protein IJX39_04660 [Clostridia bacterium]|nr:hypothetical protein [Clostridia bacterium]